MVDVAHQPGFCLPQSSQDRQRVHSEPIEKPVVPPVKEPKPKDPQVSGEPGREVTGRTQALGPSSLYLLSHHDTFSAKAIFFRAKAGPATRTHGQVPVYTPECSGAR